MKAPFEVQSTPAHVKYYNLTRLLHKSMPADLCTLKTAFTQLDTVLVYFCGDREGFMVVYQARPSSLVSQCLSCQKADERVKW